MIGLKRFVEGVEGEEGDGRYEVARTWRLQKEQERMGVVLEEGGRERMEEREEVEAEREREDVLEEEEGGESDHPKMARRSVGGFRVGCSTSDDASAPPAAAATDRTALTNLSLVLSSLTAFSASFGRSNPTPPSPTSSISPAILPTSSSSLLLPPLCTPNPAPGSL